MKALLCLLVLLMALTAWPAMAQTANIGSNCTIAWTANTESDLASYRVYGTLVPTAGTASAKTFDVLKPGTSTTCAALGLQTGGTLSVQVDAVDVLGNRSAKSVIVTAIQDVTGPAQPSGVTISANP